MNNQQLDATVHRPKRRRYRKQVTPETLELPADRIITEPERAALTTIGRSWWFRLEQRGEVPRRIKLGPKKCGWLLSEIQAWVAARVAARDTEPPAAAPAAAIAGAKRRREALRAAKERDSATPQGQQ